jgi:hypothetical protein
LDFRRRAFMFIRFGYGDEGICVRRASHQKYWNGEKSVLDELAIYIFSS